MTIAVAIRVTVLTSAWVLGTATIADAEPVRAVNDEIVCFVHAIEPWKTDHGSMAPINYGFKVHCTGRPAMRSVTTKLWRYDAADGSGRSTPNASTPAPTPTCKRCTPRRARRREFSTGSIPGWR